MRTLVVGLGIQGNKRLKTAGPDVVATVDPVVSTADYKTLRDVPEDAYDAAVLSVPDQVKIDLMRYLLSKGKHILVEKPLLSKDPKKLKELRDLARKSRTACYTAYNHRFEPNIERLKTLIGHNRIGRVYTARLYYGNGTARDVKGSPWRDKGIGVVSDLASHLLDLTIFLFGKKDRKVATACLNRFENRAYDHAILISHGRPSLELEMTLVSWKNTFSIDVIGELGSAHMLGLCKWGPSTLEIRRRVFPSGRPAQEFEKTEEPDPTWEKEYRHFKKLCRTGGTNIDNDIWINSILRSVPERSGAARRG